MIVMLNKYNIKTLGSSTITTIKNNHIIMNKQNILDVTGMAVLTTMYEYKESFLRICMSFWNEKRVKETIAWFMRIW